MKALAGFCCNKASVPRLLRVFVVSLAFVVGFSDFGLGRWRASCKSVPRVGGLNIDESYSIQSQHQSTG